MPIITLNGLCGGGSQEIGSLVAQSMGLDYIDRMIMKMSAEKIGTDIEVLEKKEQNPSSFLSKLGTILSKATLCSCIKTSPLELIDKVKGS